MIRSSAVWTCCFTLILCMLSSGCRRPVQKDYARPLPPGAHALRKLSPQDYPDLKPAWTANDRSLREALERSLAWFDKPSTQNYYPLAGVTHGQMRASVAAFEQLLETSTGASQFEQRIFEEFDVYTSVGWDGGGTVLLTGYHSPIYNASWEKTHEYRYPIYKLPTDLQRDPKTGQTLGRRVGNVVITYPTRARINAQNHLAGQEMVWLKDKLDAYLIEVNGSAKLILTDGKPLYVGYAGNNGHDYTSIGKLLVRDGKIDAANLSLPTLRAYFQQRPGELDDYLNRNDRVIFFQQYRGDDWPSGSLGFKVAPWRTLATDKDVFPRAGVVLVQTQVPGETGGKRAFEQFMLDQDTGGAIRSAGRADIYMGVGAGAETLAGRQNQEGRLYYFILKPQRLKQWTQSTDPATQSIH